MSCWNLASEFLAQAASTRLVAVVVGLTVVAHRRAPPSEPAPPLEAPPEEGTDAEVEGATDGSTDEATSTDTAAQADERPPSH